MLVLTLEGQCRAEVAPVCPANQTCIADGCGPLFTQPETLPTLAMYNTDAGPTDAYVAPDAFRLDARTPDAGMDAFVAPDVYAPDAYAPDAMTDGVFPRITRFASPAEAFEALGTSVAISNGDEVAVGAGVSLGDFVYNASDPSARPTQLALGPSQPCGQSGVINAAGDVIAFGCPLLDRVVIWSGPPWVNADAPGPALNFLGTAVAMNLSGGVVVSSSVMTLHAFDGGSANLTQPVALAGSMSLSDDGIRLVAGFPGLVETYFLADVLYSRDSSAAIVTAGMTPSVALSRDGNTLVVGDVTADGSRGHVRIFHRGMTQWEEHHVIAGTVMSGRFGASVAINATGSRIAVGAPGESADCTGLCARGTIATGTGSGAVYVFDGDGMREAYIRPPDVGGSGDFGHAIVLNRSGTRLVIGEPRRSGGGAVYLVE